MEDTAVMREAAVVEKAAEAALWERKSQKKKLSRSASSSDSDEMYSDNFSKGGKAIPPSANAIENCGVDIITNHMVNKMLILDHANLPPSTMSSEGHQNTAAAATATSTAAGGTYFTEAIGESGKEEQPPSELDLRKLYHLANSHNFQCPSCKACITRVIIVRDILDMKTHAPPPSPPPTKHPIGGTRQMPVAPPSHEATSEEMVERETILCGNCFSFLSPLGDWISSRFGFGDKKPEIGGTDIPTDPGSSGIKPPTEIPVGGAITIAIPSGSSAGETVEADRNLGKGRKLEVIKSIVYGGLIESITSLGIVTSAASAKTPTENILALALANLITGLIVIVNNLSGLKSSDPKKEPNVENTEAESEATVDQYEEVLGDRQHYVLHSTLAILSFLVFGLLPPLVYGFSFRDTDDGDLKLAATAISSLLCIALLAIGKAYIQKAQKWHEYVKTVTYYITIGFGASGLSYLAGKEFDELLQKLGWFKRNDPTPTLSLPDVDFANSGWGSY